METKIEKGKRLLNARLPKATKALELITNLGAGAAYEISVVDAQRSVADIQQKLDEIRYAFKLPNELVEAKPVENPLAERIGLSIGENGINEPLVRWAYDKLRSRDFETAEILLYRALGGNSNKYKRKGK